MHKLLIVIIGTGLFLAGLQCSSQLADDGGGATETTNGIALTAGGDPVTNATVILIDAENWLEKSSSNTSVIYAETSTDKNGAFSFNKIPTTRCDLIIETAKERNLG